MPWFSVAMSTSITITAPLQADDEATAVHAALHGNALPRHPVNAILTEGCPVGTTLSVANKAWELDGVDDGTEPPGLTVYELPIVHAGDPVVDTDAATTYQPFVGRDGQVGYRITRDEDTTWLYLNASHGSDDGVATVFGYRGGSGDPAQDTPLHFLTPWGDEGHDAIPASRR